MKFSIPSAVTTRVARTVLVGKKHSPTILFVGGVIGVVATTVTACRATLRLEEVLQETQDKLADAHELAEMHSGYSDADHRKDVTILYVRGVVQVSKLYGPSIILGGLSIAALTGSHNILTRRNAGLTAAYAAVDKAFKEYRARVVQELGEDKDREFRYGTDLVEIDGTGKNASKKQIKAVGAEGASQYARFFDSTNPEFQQQPEYNIMFLRGIQNMANDRLRARGHVFLNELYDDLHFERTKAGSVVGWFVGAGGDDYIDFGIWTDRNMLAIHDFMAGREKAILIDFNVDGIINDFLDKL